MCNEAYKQQQNLQVRNAIRRDIDLLKVDPVPTAEQEAKSKE